MSLTVLLNYYSRKISIVFVLFCSFIQFIAAQTPTNLALNNPIELTIKGGERHVYQLNLKQNQFANVVVEQRGIDLTVRWKGADDKTIANFDEEIRKQGKEESPFVAPVNGLYKIEILTKFKNVLSVSYKVELVALREATPQESKLSEAQVLSYQAQNLNLATKYKEAITLAEKALAIREQVQGVDNPDISELLNILSTAYLRLSEWEKSETYCLRSIKIWEKLDGASSIKLTTPITNLASIALSKGALEKAEELNLRVISIFEINEVIENSDYAGTISNLGNLYRRMGEDEKAIAMYERAVKLREQIWGKDHLDVAQSLVGLQGLAISNGDASKAQTLGERILSIREKNLGSDHPDSVSAMSNLGLSYIAGEELEKAEGIYRRALTIIDRTPGNEAIKTALRNNLGEVYFIRGDFAQAISLTQQALEIAEPKFGSNSLNVGRYLDGLAKAYLAINDLEKAESSALRSLAIREKLLGANHVQLGQSCDLIAEIYAVKHEVNLSIIYQNRANLILEKNIEAALTSASERQQFEYLTSQSKHTNQPIFLHLRYLQDSKDAGEIALTKILQMKGRALDAVSNSRAALRQRFNANDQALFDQLNALHAQVAKLELNGPQKISLAEHQKLLSSLKEKKDYLDVEINRLSKGFYNVQSVSLAGVKAAIPPNSALLEFVAYLPFNVESKANEKNIYSKVQYAVYVLSRNGNTKWVDLGEAGKLDKIIDEWRKSLRDPNSKDTAQLARNVDEKIMQPVRQLLGDVGHLLISPDGLLNLIPFEALVDEKNQFLIENFSLTYLTSGRDLLRMQVPRNAASTPVIIADPAFGEAEATQIARADTSRSKSNVRTQKRQSVTTGDDISTIYFSTLNATAAEANAIRTQFPESLFLTGANATEASLKQVTAPKILHIATHGFFLTNQSSEANVKDTRAINAKAKIENPLLRSGLALAGANVRKADGEDGILTALEASGLNLWGTKLVTLSACDTGIGEVKTGEGVYGLRRAFVLAGTESLVMSLWPVSDLVTRELMTGYYKGLKQGLGRGEALRQVQLRMLKRKSREHPFYWASFIQSGEWANLDGKR